MAACPQGERYDAWQRARAGDISVIVGTRSALFHANAESGIDRA